MIALGTRYSRVARSSHVAERVDVHRRLLQMHHRAKVGHIGGNLGCLDILGVLLRDVMAPEDRFVLSKGHAAGALYVTLWSIGKLSDADLDTFHRDGTLLAGHPPARGIPEIAFATGSLGHGFGLASGLALGFRLQGQAGRVFCLTSDGEWNEGSSWEALIFATHHRLANLTVVIDANGLQGFGCTREVADIEPLADKFRAFGADVEEVDGHDPVALRHALSVKGDGLRVIVARTVKGHGVSFMENRMEWHYLPLTDAQYAQAIAEIDAREAACSVARDGIAQ